MGLIREVLDLAGNTIGGAIADQWLEVLEPDGMSDNQVLVPARTVHQEKKVTFGKQKTDNRVSNGSVIHVYDNQLMILIDGGKIVDYSAEPGYFKVDNSTAPSMFNGEFKDTLKETFDRFRYGGRPSTSQRVFYINTQEIKGIKFGTPTPIMYYDTKYDAMFNLKAHGTYSIKITNPLLFYSEAIPRDSIMNNSAVDIKDINEQYLSEFLTGLQTAVNNYSAEGQSVNYIQSKTTELTKHLRDVLDEDWEQSRGMVVHSVGINGISFDEESKKIMALRNKGAMLKDPSIQAGYVAAGIADGMAAAGANEGGAMNGFIGMGMAMNNGSNILGGYQQQQQAQQQQQMQQQAQQQQAQQQPVQQQQQQAPQAVAGWACECGNTSNTGKFCNNCGKPKPVVEDNSWTCSCGSKNNGKFCQNCGSPKEVKCSECGFTPEGKPKFCPNCGNKF